MKAYVCKCVGRKDGFKPPLERPLTADAVASRNFNAMLDYCRNKRSPYDTIYYYPEQVPEQTIPSFYVWLD